MIDFRLLRREEIEKVWTIDRSEVIEGVYYLENDRLVLKPEHYNVKGWPPGETEKYTPLLVECYDRGGWFYGLFDDSGLIGIAILDSRFVGNNKDQLQLKFMHVSRDYRGQGFGRQLFESASVRASEMGAKRLYISATPSEHTINFYLSLGCEVTQEPDPELLALEAEDIHLECKL